MSVINFGFGLRAELHWDPARDVFNIYLKEFTDKDKYGFRVRIPMEWLASAPVVPLTPSPVCSNTWKEHGFDPHLAVWAFPFKHKIPVESCDGKEAHIEELYNNSFIAIIQLRQTVDWEHRKMQAIEFKVITGPIDRKMWPKEGIQPLHESNDFRLPYYERIPRGGEYPECTLELLHGAWESLEKIGIVPKEE